MSESFEMIKAIEAELWPKVDFRDNFRSPKIPKNDHYDMNTAYSRLTRDKLMENFRNIKWFIVSSPGI